MMSSSKRSQQVSPGETMSSWPELFSLLGRADPTGFNNSGGFEGELDQNFQTNSDDTLRGARVWIAYSDSQGARSERWVKISLVEARQDADYLYGHCELRGAKRSFRIDRILEIADSYGEVHEPRNFFEPFISTPVGRSAGTARNSTLGQARKIINLVGHELSVLAFAAECDGKFVPREANLIVSYVALRCKDFGLNINDADIANLKKWIKLLRPDAHDLKAAIRNIAAKGETTARELVELTDLVFEADSKIKHEEKVTAKLFRELIMLEFSTSHESESYG
jgi:WYL domain